MSMTEVPKSYKNRWQTGCGLLVPGLSSQFLPSPRLDFSHWEHICPCSALRWDGDYFPFAGRITGRMNATHVPLGCFKPRLSLFFLKPFSIKSHSSEATAPVFCHLLTPRHSSPWKCLQPIHYHSLQNQSYFYSSYFNNQISFAITLACEFLNFLSPVALFFSQCLLLMSMIVSLTFLLLIISTSPNSQFQTLSSLITSYYLCSLFLLVPQHKQAFYSFLQHELWSNDPVTLSLFHNLDTLTLLHTQLKFHGLSV